MTESAARVVTALVVIAIAVAVIVAKRRLAARLTPLGRGAVESLAAARGWWVGADEATAFPSALRGRAQPVGCRLRLQGPGNAFTAQWWDVRGDSLPTPFPPVFGQHVVAVEQNGPPREVLATPLPDRLGLRIFPLAYRGRLDVSSGELMWGGADAVEVARLWGPLAEQVRRSGTMVLIDGGTVLLTAAGFPDVTELERRIALATSLAQALNGNSPTTS